MPFLMMITMQCIGGILDFIEGICGAFAAFASNMGTGYVPGVVTRRT